MERVLHMLGKAAGTLLVAAHSNIQSTTQTVLTLRCPGTLPYWMISCVGTTTEEFCSVADALLGRTHRPCTGLDMCQLFMSPRALCCYSLLSTATYSSYCLLHLCNNIQLQHPLLVHSLVCSKSCIASIGTMHCMYRGAHLLHHHTYSCTHQQHRLVSCCAPVAVSPPVPCESGSSGSRL